MKKFLSVLLTVVMIATLCIGSSVTALAASDGLESQPSAAPRINKEKTVTVDSSTWKSIARDSNLLTETIRITVESLTPDYPLDLDAVDIQIRYYNAAGSWVDTDYFYDMAETDYNDLDLERGSDYGVFVRASNDRDKGEATISVRTI